MRITFKVPWTCISQFCEKLELETKPELVLAVHRGGLPIGVKLSHLLKLPLEIVYTSRYHGISEKSTCTLSKKKKYGEILLVDDISDEGVSLDHIVKYLKKQYKIDKITTLTYCIKNSTLFVPDYYCQKYGDDTWVIFPWEVDEK